MKEDYAASGLLPLLRRRVLTVSFGVMSHIKNPDFLYAPRHAPPHTHKHTHTRARTRLAPRTMLLCKR